MSKIDYITIAVVVICISLLGLVFWKVADLNWAEENIQETEESVQVADEEDPAIEELTGRVGLNPRIFLR